MIINIRVDKLFPHPDNPRKDLGDLTELTDSIRQTGILQNLTVVPCNSNVPKWDEEEQKYTVVIGHRRLAAAKLAELERVPCAIVEMDRKTQIATMLLENIQRSDLTVYEQAQGFQMMINLGESVSEISEKTGFSETTVRRRTKLLELDQEKFKASIERGATLMDYAKLEKIQNTDLRNEVLEKIGTSNFRWALQNAIDREKSQKRMEPVIEKLKSFAIEIKSDKGGLISSLKFLRAYHDTVENLEVIIPADAEETDYYYMIRSHGSIFLYKGKTEAEIEDEANASEREAKRDAKRQELRGISKKAYHMRREFIRRVSNATAKNNITIIIGLLLKSLIDSYVGITPENIRKILNINIPEGEEFGYDNISGDLQRQPEKYLLIGAYLALDGENENYHRWDGVYCENEDLDQVYELLRTLGYKISDEELALKNGTHELFL